jgi:hypothetical protein
MGIKAAGRRESSFSGAKMLHFGVGDRETGMLLNRIVDAHKASRRAHSAVSLYALSDHREWFAETHSAYVMHGDELKQKRPQDWALMRDVRRHMGLE